MKGNKKLYLYYRFELYFFCMRSHFPILSGDGAILRLEYFDISDMLTCPFVNEHSIIFYAVTRLLFFFSFSAQWLFLLEDLRND